MNMKGNTLIGVIVVIGLIALLVGGGVIAFKQGLFSTPSQVGVGGVTTQQIVAETQTGDVSAIKVYVRDLSHDDVNTKRAVATYCVGDDGTFIIDATSSSTTTEISGQTTRGKTVTCYAFNSTFQTLEPAVVTVDEEVEHVVIDGYTVSTSGIMRFYDDTFNSKGPNVTIVSEGSDSFNKMRWKNNATDEYVPLGGFYFNVPEETNISNIDLSGSATLKGMDHASTNIVISELPTRVTTRKDRWDYVFEIDDASATPGNQVIILQQEDYLETGSVFVESSNACQGIAQNLATGYAFTKGYYRESKGTGIGYGHETDATSSAVITVDISDGDSSFYCRNV